MRRCLFLAAAFLLPGPSEAADWPQFLGPARDGHSPETGLLQSFPKKGPPVVWEREVGDGFSGPVAAGGRVYTLAADGRLHCLELETGKKVWARALNEDYRVPQSYFGVTTSPVLEGDNLVL